MRIIHFLAAIVLIFTSGYLSPPDLNEFSCADVTEIPQTECEALVALYNSTGGNSWINHTNWLVTNTPSNWYGVGVDNGSIITINLTGNHLSGELPAILGSLARLEGLYLSSNQLVGSIPVSLGNLSNLMDLFLDNNQLSGPIPGELGYLAKLFKLDLSWNQLSGQIPPALGNLNVLLFDLSANRLTGSIPPELSSLSNTTELQLQGNQLSGSIPPELGNISSLLKLNLSYNQLTGTIPENIGSLSNLKGLYLYHNQLTGTIPGEIAGLTKIEYFDVSVNQLVGPLPAELYSLSTLTYLDLSVNPLNIPISPEIGSLTNLRYLRMAQNLVVGPIPTALCNLVNLEGLDLASNQISGAIPAEFQNLTGIKELDLSYNHLEVPAAPESLAIFLEARDPDWYRTQAFDQSVDFGTEATVTALDGKTIIRVFPGSLEADAIFTFIPQPEPSQDSGDLTFEGNSFQINAMDFLGQHLTAFDQPLVVEVSYDEATLQTSEKKLALFYWDTDKSKWMDVVTTCEGGVYVRNFEENKFSVQLCHLSEFSLFGTTDYFSYLPLITH